MTESALEYRTREAEGKAAGALVLFHGRGADENDLYPLFDMLDPTRRLVGLAPRGPLMLPPGGAHWYAVRRVGYPDPDTFLPTFARASAWLDGVLVDLDVASARVVLGGFSQGAVMAYSLAFGRGRPRPGAVVAFSGFMPTVEGFELDLAALDGFPVAIGHGTYDPVIEVDWGRAARRRLEEAGAAVVYRESPLPHAIDPAWVAEVADWLESTVDLSEGQRR